MHAQSDELAAHYALLLFACNTTMILALTGIAGLDTACRILTLRHACTSRLKFCQQCSASLEPAASGRALHVR